MFVQITKLENQIFKMSHDRTSSFFRIFIPTFSFEENVPSFSSFCDLHFTNDKNLVEKKSETADLGKRNSRNRN